MASVANDSGGRRRAPIRARADGQRHAIRLGKVSKRDAEAVKFRVEQLVAAKHTGNAVERDTARWVAELSAPLADKLARVGLIPFREEQVKATLGPFLRVP